MIKVDIVNEVSRIAHITKVKAEVAVDAVFDAMRLSMQRSNFAQIANRKVWRNSSHRIAERLSNSTSGFRTRCSLVLISLASRRRPV